MFRRRLLLLLAIAAPVAAASSQTALAAIALPAPPAVTSEGIVNIDARKYHHCHNMPRRTRCHAKSRLPVNWPPNSNTPSTNSVGTK